MERVVETDSYPPIYVCLEQLTNVSEDGKIAEVWLIPEQKWDANTIVVQYLRSRATNIFTVQEVLDIETRNGENFYKVLLG